MDEFRDTVKMQTKDFFAFLEKLNFRLKKNGSGQKCLEISLNVMYSCVKEYVSQTTTPKLSSNIRLLFNHVLQKVCL